MEDGSFVDQGVLDNAGLVKRGVTPLISSKKLRNWTQWDIVDCANMGGKRPSWDARREEFRLAAEGTDGQGIMTMHDVMPGITLMFNDFTNVWNLESLTLIPGSRMLCLNYRREGELEESGIRLRSIPWTQVI